MPFMYRQLMLLAGTVIISGSVAWGAIRMGNVSISPFLGTKAVSDSNIYLDANSPRSAAISTIYPGFNLSWLRRENVLRLNAEAEFIRYNENSAHNNADHINSDFMAKFAFPVGVSFRVQDNYRNTTDPLTNQLVERVKRVQNNFQTAVGCTFNRFLSASVGYSQVLHDYLQEDYKQPLNRRESETNLEALYTYSPRLSFLVDVGQGIIKYAYAENRNNSKYLQLRTGVRGQLTAKTAAEIKAGIQNKTYDELTGNNVSASVLSLSMLTDFSERTGLILGAHRNIVESTLVNNPYYIATGGSAKLRQRFYDWEVALGGQYELNAYPQEITLNAITRQREDSNLQADFSIGYIAAKWFTVSNGITLKQRNSNFDQYNYTDVQISLATKVSF